MSVQGPVVYFELVDKDLHRPSDLVDLEQQLSFLFLVCTYKKKRVYSYFGATATLKTLKMDYVI